MSEKLCTLRTKGGGGGRYTETSLWTNSAPTSNFASQNITLSDSIGNYKYIGIKYRRTTSATDSITEIILVSEFRLATDVSYTYHIGLGGNNANSYTRRCIYQSDTAIGFSNAARIGTSGTDNSMNIPLEILGLNELDHGTMTTSNVEVFPLATVTGGTTPTYTTKGRAVAIWQMWGRTDNVGFGIRTNVNPMTGAINNNEIYMSQSGGMSWTIQSGASFTVTDTTITTTAISNNNRVVALAYTY